MAGHIPLQLSWESYYLTTGVKSSVILSSLYIECCLYLYEKRMLNRVSGSPNTLFRGASRCCHHYPHASPVVCLYPRASGSIAAVDQEAMASLMVGIGNGTTSTPMFVLQLLL